MKGITVIKFGGSLTKDAKVKNDFLKNLAALSKKKPIVLVHGGGPEINNWLERLGIQSRFLNGLRYTDSRTLEVVEMVLSGKLNKGIVNTLNSNGVKAVGLSGKDGKMILCARKSELGYVGEPKKVNPQLLIDLLENGYMPVISSLGFDECGDTLNINADSVAMAVAAALKADRLILLTDVDGVLDNEEKVIPEIKITQISDLIATGIVTGGMIPKLNACMDSIKAGVKQVCIAHGTAELNKIQGTVIKK